MEHPISGLTSPRDLQKTTTLVHGGTSLKLSEGGESPVLEAHPGSPVDITGRRPTLTTSMAARRLYHGSEEELSKYERGKKEEAIKRDGVAAKGHYIIGHRFDPDVDMSVKVPKRRAQGPQPFYIPAKVPEQEEYVHVPSPGESKMSIDASLESTAMDFEFEEDNGVWISAHPVAHESRSSLATTMSASTLIDDRTLHGTLTLDTSIASSAASMMSSVDSIQSATTNTSDIYGWEEELDRKSSFESHNAWERELTHRLPSGGRTVGPRIRGGMHDVSSKRPFGKRKSLLYRVLNISGSRERRGSVDDISMTGTISPTQPQIPATVT